MTDSDVNMKSFCIVAHLAEDADLGQFHQFLTGQGIDAVLSCYERAVRDLEAPHACVGRDDRHPVQREGPGLI